MSQAKVTIGWLTQTMTKVIRILAERMELACENRVVQKTKFKSHYEKIPLPPDDYWVYMVQISPWDELSGLFNASLLMPPETEVLVTLRLLAHIQVALGKENIH